MNLEFLCKDRDVVLIFITLACKYEDFNVSLKLLKRLGKKMKYFLNIGVLLIVSLGSVYAQSLDEAKKMYLEKNYAEALLAFEKAIQSAPRNASYNQWYGTCLLETGQLEKSEEYLKFAADKKIIEANHSLGKLYYLLYDFDNSTSYYRHYKEALIKTKMIDEAEEIDALIQRSERASRMLQRCEDIQIIDSMLIDKKNFLSAYSLTLESGSLQSEDNQTISHLNPLKGLRYFSKKAEDGSCRLYSEINLQNTWSDKKEIELFNDSIPDNNYPFVLPDGITIYFASSTNQSIGGYDLFITRYNTNNDSYLAPNQLGMPFNSIANDYMLAIDEVNNLGYFATDRFQPEDKVVVYTFIPNEQIKSIEAEDSEDLIARAKITSIQDSWRTGNNYKEHLAQAQKNIQDEQIKASREFYFVMNDNTIYHSLSDFRNDAAKQSFVKSQELRESIDSLEKELDQLRKEYTFSSNANQSKLSSSILSKEKTLEKMIIALKEAEKRTRNLEIR